jgi:hypothetical protein
MHDEKIQLTIKSETVEELQKTLVKLLGQIDCAGCKCAPEPLANLGAELEADATPPPPVAVVEGLEDVDEIVDIDINGLPWDERIHASSHNLNKDGTWRNMRGITDKPEFLRQVEDEIRIGPVRGGQPAAEVVAPPPPPVAVPDEPEEATYTFANFVDECKAKKMGVVEMNEFLKSSCGYDSLPLVLAAIETDPSVLHTLRTALMMRA